MASSERVHLVDDIDGIMATYKVMSQLRPGIAEPEYLETVKLQQVNLGFQLAVLEIAGSVTCVAGFRICWSLGWGKYLYVDDLVTDSAHRSKGYGKLMLDWLVEYGRQHKCGELRLDSAVYRYEAHRFYLRERMNILCHHFALKL